MSDFKTTRLNAGGFDAAADDETVASRKNDGPIPGKRLVEVVGSNVALAEAVTPADGTDLPLYAANGPASSLYVGGSGDVVVTVAGVDITFTGMASGVWHPMPPYTRVKATGTTATDLIAGY